MQGLHHQLSSIRERQKPRAAGARVVGERHKLIVCACRRPIFLRRGEDGADVWVYEESQV